MPISIPRPGTSKAGVASVAPNLGPSDVRLCAYHSLDELQILRPAWDLLLSEYPPATTFSTWEWLSCWWQCFGGNRQLLVLALFDQSSLVGLAPFSISTESTGWTSLRVLRLMGDGSGDSDNLDLIVRPGFEMRFAELILGELTQRRRLWDVCQLNSLPPNTLVGERLRQLLSSSPWVCFEYRSKSSAVHLGDSWDTYSQLLSSEDRKNLVRYARRMQTRYGTKIYRCTDPDQVPCYLDALFRLHQERWQHSGQTGSFSLPERREFYSLLSRCLLHRGWLELWVLELDGTIAAVQFAFRYGARVFQLQEGYDPKRASDRVGFVLRGEVLKQLISEKVQVYDFLGGQDPYKARWGAREGHYLHLHFAPRFGRGAVWLQYVNTASRSKEWLRDRVPASAWKLLHKANQTLRRTTAMRSQPPHPD